MTTSDDDKITKGLLFVVNLTTWIIGVFTLASMAHIGSWMWLWFMVPLGLPIIGVWQTLGLIMFSRLFFSGNLGSRFYAKKAAVKDDKEGSTYEFSLAVFGFIGVWIIGFIGFIASKLMV
jgi:hypothetical protein